MISMSSIDNDGAFSVLRIGIEHPIIGPTGGHFSMSEDIVFKVFASSVGVEVIACLCHDSLSRGNIRIFLSLVLLSET